MLPYLLILGGLVLLYFGAEWMVGGSSKLAVRFGVKPVLVGLTIVAFGTSAPELVVSIHSTVTGVGGIAVGNVIGSNIFNVALILGLSAMIRPIHITEQLIRVDVPVVIGASFLMTYLLWDRTVAILEGVILLILLVVYMSFTIISAKREKDSQEKPEKLFGKKDPFVKDIALIVIGLVLLVGGARVLVNGAVTLATRFGVSEAVIGLTIVSIGTSLPELATSVVAALKRHNDIAVGNIIGSNLFNIFSILGFAGILGPVVGVGIELRDLFVMLLVTVLLLPMLWTRFTLTRYEGAVLFMIFLGYIYMVWPK
ncbi:MAG: calcium/sodium antiporter [Chitinispirillaceae bacterium]